jgi:hypothetical protein
MREDWWEESVGRSGRTGLGRFLEVTWTLFSLTELFLFASRLVEAFRLTGDVVLSYRLFRLEGRQLQTADPRRVPLSEYREAAADLHHFGQELSVPATTLIADASRMAIDESLRVYQLFRWEPARETVEEEQRRLLERRL